MNDDQDGPQARELSISYDIPRVSDNEPATRVIEDPRTLGMSVKNIGFLLDRLGADCAPLQFLRELTQNSLEATLRSKTGKGTIVWDLDHEGRALDPTSPFKLSITDTGIGMTGDEMVENINKLASSGSVQGIDGNFGVGAKIAALTRNHAGLIYLSWKDGQGAMIHVWRDPKSGQYGLRQMQRPDKTWDVWAPVGDEVKPKEIKQHGTKVVLLGMLPEQDTMEAPPGAASPSAWVAKYLNSRYFSIPSGITVRARQGWASENEQTNLLRQITGQEPYLRRHSTDEGHVELHGATAHWWILADSTTLGQNSGFIESAGHVAVLHKNELYELTGGRQGVAKLQQFGVLFGARQVVIYIEPKSREDAALTTNTARTELLLGGKPLPMSDWAAEFRDKMPVRLATFMEEIAARSDQKDHAATIRERLKGVLELFRVSRYRSQEDGQFSVDEPGPGTGGHNPLGESGPGASSEGADSAATSSLSVAEVPEGGQVGGVYASVLKADGRRAAPAKDDPFPKVTWISRKDGTRAVGDIEDKAARYIDEQHVLLINGDFRTFVDMEEHWIAEYEREHGKVGGLVSIVRDIVHNWYEQALVEAIIGLQGLRGSREWTVFDLKEAWSEAALTSVVMQRYHPYNAVKRDLAIRMGSLKKTAQNQRGA